MNCRNHVRVKHFLFCDDEGWYVKSISTNPLPDRTLADVAAQACRALRGSKLKMLRSASFEYRKRPQRGKPLRPPTLSVYSQRAAGLNPGA